MKKVAPGVYRLADGQHRAFVRVKGQLYSKRFAAHLPPQAAKDWREEQRGRVKYAATLPEPEPEPAPAPSTFGADIETYLDAVKAMAGYTERKRHLYLWREELGADRVRCEIAPFTIQAVLHRWRKSGLAEDTCNKRRTALMAMWNKLDGKSALNPVRDAARFRPPEPEPRGIDYKTIRRIFEQMPESATKIRLQVMAYTGLRPVQLRTLQRTDWDKRHKRLTLPATSKGRGTRRRTVSLLPEATAALQRFDREDLWSTSFGSAPMGLVWRRALKRVGITRRIVPYDLRHSFGTAAYQAEGDLGAVQALLGHSSIRMTQRYTLGAVDGRVEAAIKTLAGYLSASKKRR